MKEIGKGILSWCREERQSDRYGFFNLLGENHYGTVKFNRELDLESLLSLEGKRVRVSCNVLESRVSGHAGDRHLEIFPTQPELGEEVVLGVGILQIGKVSWDDQVSIGLQPSDGRSKFWINPEKLYHLHDQTVSLHIEETSEPFTEAWVPSETREGVIANGDSTFQWKGNVEPSKIAAKVTPLGEGTFLVGDDFSPGESVRVLSWGDSVFHKKGN